MSLNCEEEAAVPSCSIKCGSITVEIGISLSEDEAAFPTIDDFFTFGEEEEGSGSGIS